MLNEKKINVETIAWFLIVCIGFLLIQQGIGLLFNNKAPSEKTNTEMTSKQASTVEHIEKTLSAEGFDYNTSYHDGSPAYVDTPITSAMPYTHMEIGVNTNGDIYAIHYMLNVNTDIPKDEALNVAVSNYGVLNHRLQNIEMNEELKTFYLLSDKFLTDYNASDKWGTLYDENGLIKEYSITDNTSVTSRVSFQAIPSTPNDAVLHIFLSI